MFALRQLVTYIMTENESLHETTDTSYEIEMIQEWKKYGEDVIKCCNELLEHGHSKNHVPKQPSVPLSTLSNENTNHKIITRGTKSKEKNARTELKLVGHDLHVYLQDHIYIEVNKLVSLEFKDKSRLHSLDRIKDILIDGYRYIKSIKSPPLHASLTFGNNLNYAFTVYCRMKTKQKNGETWKKWLEKHVDIKDSYARKLRVIAKLLENYQRFKKVSIPFTEVYKRRREIQEMLENDESICQYWKQII